MQNEKYSDTNDTGIVNDGGIEAERQAELESVQTHPEELLERLEENHSTSPADSGGDIDAAWEDAEGTGAEAVFGHNPTPDQSDVEENAHAMGINFEDNEPLDFTAKMEKRDANRYELDEASKGDGDTI